MIPDRPWIRDKYIKVEFMIGWYCLLSINLNNVSYKDAFQHAFAMWDSVFKIKKPDYEDYI